ncbi:2-oxoacid:acceptor oxidoreductase family protein [Hippea maritima]|uniref:Pyruvate/ketoisovalerate oxidoreductase n=1 Tax=Hippea maritima (strain ATCC 700847 / DSM 10411 / MH2) TaxID=760142 RepID=F2LUT8_HIPMA|nr:2-oxoacid:acceptor oxidoreductase family protein [Hippea maritima]AEA33543.1 Pyruvate/ketoisovalerate oxidoreductase [Hippea maritima DSM 10411]
MKIVILGVGGMGAISLSKTIASMAISKGLSVKSSEIHGMAKKGGLVEIQMKVGEGLNGVVLQGEADFVIVLDERYREYGFAFLKKEGRLLMAEANVREQIAKEFGDVKFVSSYILGLFVKLGDVFIKDDALEVLRNFKDADKNLMAFGRGLK